MTHYFIHLLKLVHLRKYLQITEYKECYISKFARLVFKTPLTQPTQVKKNSKSELSVRGKYHVSDIPS